MRLPDGPADGEATGPAAVDGAPHGAWAPARRAKAPRGDVRVGHVTGRAGVSRRTFYEHYPDMEACLVDLYRT